jgi:hypothetical protein
MNRIIRVPAPVLRAILRARMTDGATTQMTIMTPAVSVARVLVTTATHTAQPSARWKTTKRRPAITNGGGGVQSRKPTGKDDGRTIILPFYLLFLNALLFVNKFVTIELSGTLISIILY